MGKMCRASRLAVVLRSLTALQLLVPHRIETQEIESLVIGSLVCSGKLPPQDKFLLVDVSNPVKTYAEPCYNPLVSIDPFLFNVKKVIFI